MVHRNEDYAYKEVDCSNGDMFINCDLGRVFPNTPLFKGRKGLVFINTNLCNACVPDDAIFNPKPDQSSDIDNWLIRGGNNSQISICSHNQPEMMKYGLPECRPKCEHISWWSYIKSVLLNINPSYRNTIYG